MTDATEEPVFSDLVVTAADFVADGIRAFELRHPDGAPLPAFTAGSHVPVMTPSGALRRYSLCNDPHEDDRYQIAVKRDAAGRGGSISMVDAVNVGDRLRVGEPRSEFALAPRLGFHFGARPAPCR